MAENESIPIAEARPGEEMVLRDVLDEWSLGSKTRPNEKLHIPEDGKPYCEQVGNRTTSGHGKDIQWVTKGIKVYPPGYREICPWCIDKYRRRGLP